MYKKIFFIQLLFILVITPKILYSNDKFTIAIDVGHTKTHFGTVSARGITEYEFNKDMANVLLKKILMKKGLNAFIINPEGDKISLKERTQIALEKNADLFISLHHDSVQPKYLSYWNYNKKKNHYSDNFSGYSIFISKINIHSDKSYKFATFLGEQFKDGGFVPTLHHAEKIKGENRKLLDNINGIYEFNDLVVLKSAKIPAVLLECGIIVNRMDELLINSNGYKEEFTDRIVNAILEYNKWIKNI